MLPPYTSGDPPLYSCPLRYGEQRLQETPRVIRPLPSGAYVKKAGNITITLFDQEDDAQLPTYGRNGSISGSLSLKDSNRVIEVAMKVRGKLEVLTTEGGSGTTQLLASGYSLWNRKDCQDACPGFIPFSYNLPAISISGNPLPPSYDVRYPGVPSLFVKCKYFVNFQITIIRNHTLDLLTKTKCIVVPFQYLPRMRPHRPIVYIPCFYSAMKALPEEWYQVVTRIPPRPGLQLQPLHCQFFIPSSKIYGIRDKIPFHIQLTGALASHRRFLRLPNSDDIASCPLAKKAPLKTMFRPKPNFTVLLVRQTRVETRLGAVWRNSMIGTGQVRQVVPPFSCCPTRHNDELHFDWDGEIHLDENVKVGSFAANNVTVQDSIVLSIDPVSQERQPPVFVPVSITVPIRLVTDSYVEEIELD